MLQGGCGAAAAAARDATDEESAETETAPRLVLAGGRVGRCGAACNVVPISRACASGVCL
jgi:hypothetical protein